MKTKIIINILLLFNLSFYSQSTFRESWSVGAGLSNFMMNGDLKAKKSFINLGGYIYADKMISPSVGFELKLAYTKLSGQGNDDSFTIYNTLLSETNFEGTAFEGETNVIYNISTIFDNIHKNKDRKFNFSALMGIGIHRYNSILYNSTTNEVLADFGDSPSKNGSTTSIYYTTGFNVKYKFNKNIDFELRQNFNFNEEDHLDAAVSKKSSQDFYFKTSLGIVYSFNKKEHKNFVWYDKSENTILKNDILVSDLNENDDDNDGVINMYDIQKDTPKNAIVYGNGVAIDSDEDGIIDLYDECPLEYAITKTGCLKDIDTDNDGVIDSEDECPNEYAKSLTGCLKDLDSDKDGIIDSLDKCPNEYAKSLTGCLKDQDTDKDGVIDSLDKCPSIYGNTLNGCPKKKNPLKIKPTKKVIVNTIKDKTETNNKPLTFKEKHKLEIIKEVNKKNTKHGNYELDNSVNINDVDTSPIYPGCLNKISQFDKTNCIISSISKYVNQNYNKNTANSINGKVRVLFIVKEDGSTKVIDVLGNYNLDSKKELKRVIETLPKIQPGTLKGIPVPVKYSLLFLLK
jgi:hypothetical protein